MSNVFNLADFRDGDQEAEETHVMLTGPARCLACKHEFVTSVPAGDDIFDLVCPKCDTRRGQFIYPPNLPASAVVWRHSCGGTVFTPVLLDPEGMLAKNLGVLSTTRAACEMKMLCHGCGVLLTAEDMAW